MHMHAFLMHEQAHASLGKVLTVIKTLPRPCKVLTVIKTLLQLIIPEKLPCFDLTPIGTAYHAYVKVQMFQDLSLLFA